MLMKQRALWTIKLKKPLWAVNYLAKNITIILIAHRLTTVKKCENFFIGKRRNKKSGTFEELMKINDNFRNHILNK